MPRPNRRWQCSDRGRRRGNTSWQEAREPGERPPPGLRGRAIGLFYRDRNKGKKNKERIRNLEIPTGVEKRVKTLLQSIKHIAESQKVEIKQVSIQKYLSNKKIELDKVIDTSDGHHSNDDHMSLSENNATVNNIKEENQEFSSTVKIEMGQSYSEENIEAGFLPLSNKAITDKEGDKIFLNKECTQTGISVKLEVEDSTAVKTEPTEALGPNSLSPKDEDVFKRPLNKGPEPQPSSSTSADFIPFGNDILGAMEYGAGERRLSLRSTGEYKYGYYDIITGSFSEKLDECIANGVSINITSSNVTDESEYLLQEYNEMVQRVGYKKIMEFRKKLPTYKKSTELLEVIENNQVVVISGETGCGKSTQVPQIILDDAICKKRGANIKILVTQPRRIAASSLAARVSEERDEQMGKSVGYAVRLEKVEPRARGSIIYCTTGILLADLETNQGLTAYSHIILDEVHERDCHIDMSMMMLKQILKKRTDLKLILMSATIDADRLSAYFDNSPMMHIEGLAYPVEDVYLEDILKITNFQFLAFEPKRVQFRGHGRGNKIRRQNQRHEAGCMEELIQFRAKVGPWVESIKHTIPRSVYENLLNPKSEELTVNTDLILALITQICKMEHGAILVFVPGIAQISKILSKMQDSGMFPYPQFEIYPLHSKLPTLQQHKIFQKPPPGVRKIIVATNIAETSITIDDIVYVVDSGRMKLSGLNVEENVSTLATEWIAQANLRQRRGRAGRCQPGVCYHLMTSFRASQLAERVLPELQRSDLLEPVLMMKKLRLGAAGPALDHVPDPPAASTVKWAVEHLQQCGALDGSETLTPLGWHLARLPVHPAAGKLLLLGALFGVLDRAASVAAVWGFKDPFMMVIGKEDEANAAKKQLALGEPSDHIAISEAIITWEGLPRQERGAFAYAHFLSGDTLRLLSEMKQQLGRDLHQMGFLPSGSVKAPWENRNAHNLSLFKAVVAASLYPKIGTVRWKKMNARNPRKGPRHMTYTPEEGRVEVHPGSVLAVTYHHHTGARVVCDNPGASWLVYWLKQRSTKLYLIEVTMVYTLPLLFFGELRICDAEDGNPDECIISITSIKVRCNRQTAQLLFELRCLLDQVLASKVTVYSEHAYRSNDFEEYVLNAVTELITAEDEQVDYSSDDNEFSDQSDCESSQRNYNWTNE